MGGGVRPILEIEKGEAGPGNPGNPHQRTGTGEINLILRLRKRLLTKRDLYQGSQEFGGDEPSY